MLFATKKLAPQVVAFEPDPGNYAHLLANLHVNDLAEQDPDTAARGRDRRPARSN